MTESTTGSTTREAQVSEYAYRRPRRRGPGLLAFLIGVVLLLGAIAVVGDRVAAKLAADELRTQLVAEMSDRDVQFGSLEVNIRGFPFLAQVARGFYDEITIDMTDVKLPAGTGRGATLPALHVVAKGVDADTADVVKGTAKITAEQVTGTAVVSFRTLETLVDYSRFRLSDVKFTDSAGGLKLSGNADLAGVRVPISATADITVTEGQLQVTLRDATAVNLPAPQIVKNYLGDLAERSILARLPQLPFGMTLDQVRVQTDGLAITATGRDVPLVA